MSESLLIINIAGLGAEAVTDATPNLLRLSEMGGRVPVQPPVPALTSVSQATLLTGTCPAEHGIVGNGWYFRELSQVLNWQRSARLLTGTPLWEAFRDRNPEVRCANLFWRYATHSTADLNVTERPTYWADGRKSPDIYSEPSTVRDELVERLGPFPLFRFWGPAADIVSSRWITDATLYVLEQQRFGVILTYLPHLDYDHQRYGPDSSQGLAALRAVDQQAGRLIDAAVGFGMRVVVLSDYAFETVSQPVYLNRVLREAGLLRVQRAENGELLEPGVSTAFAVCDQQVAHIYVNRPSALAGVRTLLADTDGVERVLHGDEMRSAGIGHPRSGELLALAEAGHWFAYPYWLEAGRAPDFAGCVAIHDKPGFDPAELLWAPGWQGKMKVGWRLLQKSLGLRAPFDLIQQDPTAIRGSHGRVPTTDATRPVLITSWPVGETPPVLMEAVRSLLV
ncbi:MAG: alkaline phosphatase family protein [Planctomycetaceae bacterium]|nr:alkaline phosphatase family protein [Planctomycetaceae bacterium]